MRYGHHDQVSWLCFEGAVRYTEARELKAFIERVVLPEMGDTMILDLRAVDSIDSTGLGLLAWVGRHALEHFSRRAVILCPEGQVAQNLRAMQFDKLFTLTGQLEQPPELTISPVQPPTGHEPLATVMLGAHKELSSIDGKNKARFHDVVNVLEQAVARRKGQ